MLSILIPIYNFDVRELVRELHQQCQSEGIVFEICCFDDQSEVVFQNLNQEIADLENVNYLLQSENLGRSAIRNAMARAAYYDNLLFMDCDSKVVQLNYIKTYLAHLQANTVLYGGRVYDANPPSETALRLHWTYGRVREQSRASERKKQPYNSFMTNNFLIPKSIFQTIRFDESLRQYGHEDTLFGLELRKRSIPIVHLDNPLEHLGLEAAATFLKKTEQGVENLVTLWQSGKLTEAKLLHFFEKCRQLRLLRLLYWLFQLSVPFLRYYFTHRHGTNLKLFDFYKLGVFIENYFATDN